MLPRSGRGRERHPLAGSAALFLFAPVMLLAGGALQAAPEGSVPGPDIVVGDMVGLAQFGTSGTPPSQFGLALGTTVCNAGSVETNFAPMPSTEHPVIAHNFYRMSGGSANDERFEQIGQSWVKHTYGATQEDHCGFDCTPASSNTRLGAVCSDPYASTQNATQNDLGSRAWVNPFTGVFQSNARDHTGHIHTGTSHRILVESNDLNPPQATTATIGFFKTGAPVSVGTLGPDATNATPTPIPTVTPSATPTPAPLPTPSPGGIPARAINLSTRILVGTGENVGIGGFILPFANGVILRAMGPSLAGLGVPNALADPVMELHGPDGFATVTNDNWRDSGSVEQLQSLGLAPFYEAEAAMRASLEAGAYTIVVRGKNNTSGVALVEIYCANGSPFEPLANISTRALVGTADDIVIAGFILGGESVGGPHTGPDRIVVRGLGPQLAALDVENYLEDPRLELRDNNGALLIANNDWQDDPAQAAQLTAAGLAFLHPLEAGLAVTLPPGLYTALLSGANNGTGVGLVEVYDLGGP